MKHKILTPIVTLGGVGGVTTPIVINTTGIAQKSTIFDLSQPGLESMKEDASVQDSDTIKEQVTNSQEVKKYSKCNISSLFLWNPKNCFVPNDK